MALARRKSADARLLTVRDDGRTLVLRLESGETVTHRMADLLRVPEDEDGQKKMAAGAAEEYAFWTYQAARARERQRFHGRETDTVVADTDINLRTVIDAGHHPEARIYGWASTDFGLVNRLLDSDEKVQVAREAAAIAEHDYEVLRGVAEAVRQRNQILFTALRPVSRNV